MRNRFFVSGILIVGLLWQIPIAAAQSTNTLTRTSGTTVTPSAGATVSPVSVSVTQTAADTFAFVAVPTGFGSAPIVSYAWNFGDNATAGGANVSHSYTVAGSYQVLVTVTDSNGLRSSASTNVVSGSTTVGPTSVSILLVTRGTRFEFTARSTSGNNGTLQSFSWNFGDGATGSGASVVHYYNAAGTYTVVLTAVDSNGVSSTTTKTVTASGGNLSPGAGSPSASIIATPMSSDTYDFKVAANRSRTAIGTYIWNFGDGSSGAGADVSHRYMSSGTYTVTLAEVSASGATSVAIQNVTVSAGTGSGAPPTATIIATATASDTFAFSSTASAATGATIVSYNWNFGDGATATGSTASHTYSASGTYTVVLTVVDSKGASGTATKSVTATVATQPPSVTISAVQTALDAYDFTGVATAFGGATIASYAWDFGDGTATSGAAASHRYTVSGTFPVVLTVTDSKGKSGKATKSVTATVTGPPPPPPSSSGRVQIAMGGTTGQSASVNLASRWVQGGGDWLDKNGIFNGPTPTISIPITSSPVTIDISGIDGDLLLRGVDSWSAPVIDGQPAQGFWTDPSSGSSLPLPQQWGPPATGFVLNPARGHFLTITTTTGKTLRIDKVAGPLIPTYPFVGPSNTPDILNLEMTNQAAIIAAAGGSQNIQIPLAFNPEFLVDPTGMKYLRFSNAGAGGQQGLINWFLPFAPRDTAYSRYCMYIESDVRTGFNELGMKLPGLSNIQNVPPPEPLYYVMEHGQPAPNNDDVYGLTSYFYDASSGAGFGEITSIGNSLLRANQWYCIEQYINIGTPGVANGSMSFWINGNKVYDVTGRKMRNSATSHLQTMNVLFYHGGMGRPVGPMHYRIAKVGVSSSRIGVPQELLGGNPPSPPSGTYPAWRKAMTTRDTLYPIANTAAMDGQASLGNGSQAQANIIDAWNGLAAGPHTWYSAASSGHDGGDGTGWENKTIKIDLSADAPQWQLIHPGSPRSAVITTADHYLDGLPVSRHTYKTAHFLPSKNRVFLVGVAGPYAIGFPSPPVPFEGGAAVDAFDVTTNKWDAARTVADAPTSGFSLGVNVDPRTDDIYVARTRPFYKLAAATNTWTSFYPLNPDLTAVGDPGDWRGRATMIDTIRNRWCHFGGVETGANLRVQCIDLTTHVLSERTITGDLASSPAYGAIVEDSHVVHDLDGDRYLTVQLEPSTLSGLYAIDPSTFVSRRIATVPSPLAGTGTQNRLAYFSELGGIAYLPQFSSNILFMPTR